MLEQLVLLHHPSSSTLEPAFESQDFVQWRTCLRSIALGFSNYPSEYSTPQKFEKYQGAEAYRFLMEVVCGLHSPILGETEVMGQFKSLLDASEKILNIPQRKVFTQLITDAKRVRQKYLLGAGSRSYGSLLRRYLKNSEEVTILGAGRLAQDILPWLKNGLSVNILCRDVQKVRKLLGDLSVNDVNTLFDGAISETLVIAASMKTQELECLLKNQNQIKKVIDLRDVSSRDPLRIQCPVVTLEQLFSDIEACEKEMQSKVGEAKNMIAELSQKYFHAAELRPFGWEDLCG